MIFPVRSLSHNLNRTESEECVALADICKKHLFQDRSAKIQDFFQQLLFWLLFPQNWQKCVASKKLEEAFQRFSEKLMKKDFTSDESVRDLINLESDCGLFIFLTFYKNACWYNKDRESRRNWMQNLKWKISRYQQNDDLLPAYQMQNWHQSLLYCSYKEWWPGDIVIIVIYSSLCRSDRSQDIFLKSMFCSNIQFPHFFPFTWLPVYLPLYLSITLYDSLSITLPIKQTLYAYLFLSCWQRRDSC